MSLVYSNEECKCPEFDANRAHQWILFPPEDDFFQDLNRGDFPDWLKIQESDEAIHAALCRAKSQVHLNPFKRKVFVDELEPEEDEVPSVVPIEKLPLESLLPLINTYQFPASHKGMESIPFWIKIYARFWTSYGFYFVKVGHTEFSRFRLKCLDPNDVWMLPYWCLRKQYRGEWYRCMVLVVRDTWQDSPWGERILDAYDFLKAIASVSVSNNKNLRRIRHIASPMIPHALQWMCHLMPDCYEDFTQEYCDDNACLSHDGILNCSLKIGSEGEYIDRSDQQVRKWIPFNLPRTGGPFVFDYLDRCFFIAKNYTEGQLQDLIRRTGAKIWKKDNILYLFGYFV